jgi:hypothetical protein
LIRINAAGAVLAQALQPFVADCERLLPEWAPPT